MKIFDCAPKVEITIGCGSEKSTFIIQWDESLLNNQIPEFSKPIAFANITLENFDALWMAIGSDVKKEFEKLSVKSE